MGDMRPQSTVMGIGMKTEKRVKHTERKVKSDHGVKIAVTHNWL